MADENKPKPEYKGLKTYVDPNGMALLVPNDWYQYDLKDKRKGVVFSPYPDDFNTGLLLEKRRIKVNVTEQDLPILREAFYEGIKALPGVEIEQGSEQDYVTQGLSFFELRFTFLEGDVRRKRWVRNIYWGKNNYILIAQGRTPEDFELWLPMFYNIIMNAII